MINLPDHPGKQNMAYHERQMLANMQDRRRTHAQSFIKNTTQKILRGQPSFLHGGDRRCRNAFTSNASSMSEFFFRLLAVAAGITLAVQPPLNARLRTAVGDPLWTSFTSFVVGAIALALLAIVVRAPLPQFAVLGRGMPWWAWTGGLCGVLYVTLALIVTPRIGGAALLSLAVLGMMAGAIFIDHFGLFDLPERHVSFARIAGAVLVVGGVTLIAR